MEFIPHFLIAQLCVEAFSGDGGGHAQDDDVGVMGDCMKRRHELSAKAQALMVRADEDAADHIAVEASRGDDLLILGRYKHLALAEQDKDRRRGKAFLHLRNDVGRVVLGVGVAQGLDDDLADGEGILLVGEPNLIAQIMILPSLAQSPWERARSR